MSDEDIDLAGISEPDALERALAAAAVSEGEAFLVVLHRADEKSIARWVKALPRVMQADFAEYARGRVTSRDTFRIGRGISLDESPTVGAALRAWLSVHDQEYRRPLYLAQPPDQRSSSRSTTNPRISMPLLQAVPSFDLSRRCSNGS